MHCFTKTNRFHVYYYDKCLFRNQVIFWSNMLMYKISGSSPRSTRPTILWVLVRGNSDCRILDNISCCALVSYQQIASCARRILLERWRSASVSYWWLWTTSTAWSAWSVSWKEIVELLLQCGWSCVEMFFEQGSTADWLYPMRGGCLMHSAARHLQTDSRLLWESNSNFSGYKLLFSVKA